MSKGIQTLVLIACPCVAALSAGCGGRVSDSPAEANGSAPPTSSSSPNPPPAVSPPPEPDPPPSKSRPHETDPANELPTTRGDPSTGCSSSLESLSTELVWWRENDPYGIHSQVFFAFSPDGRRLVTPGDQYLIDGFGELSATDGSVLFQTQSGLQARDAAWDRELVINVGETFSFAHRAVVEIATERVLLELDEPNWPTTSPATLSSDGEKLITLSCDQIERRGVTDAAIDVLPFDSTGSGCTGNTALTVSARGNAAIFAPTDDGEIRLADFSELRLSTFRGHAPASELDPGTPHPTHSVLAIALSPNEQRLATTGADRTLRIWSHPEFEQLLPDIPISWSTAFTNCYCSYRSFAPVAWSPDGALLASPDSEHNTALRRACDGQIIATLEAPASDAVFSPEPQGPAFLAFTPRGDGLAVFRMGSLAFYRIAR